MTRLDPQPILEVLHQLLGPNGCPWDREQTSYSLCEYLVEEVHELVAAVRGADKEGIVEELGDVSFLLFFLAELLSREYGIGLQQAWQESARKMKRRHPHVFSDTQFQSRQELWQSWERIKSQEKTEADPGSVSAGKMASIPDSLPPLTKAYRIHSKAEKSGFTWAEDKEQEGALLREWQEWIQARDRGDQSQKEEEFGDLLFSLVEQGRRQGIKAAAALELANQKFQRRFQGARQLAERKGLDWDELDMEAKDTLWEEVKRREREDGVFQET